jgi:class 3 adenylate cyclase
MIYPAGTGEAERRFATVMFADIVGFTAMSEKMDPEDLTILMNLCFSMMENVIDGFGGVVDKFIGDCVMALFGVPVASENAAQRAVNAAIELKGQIVTFNNDHSLATPLGLHVGINTGMVVAGDIGGNRKRDYTVMGETVNIASRLESASLEGQILVGPDTYSSTQHLFRFRELKNIPIKGKKAFLRVYELLSAHKSIHRKISTKQRKIFSQLIGRNSEISFMENRLMRLNKGSGGIINLVGEAGAGKTRIILELKNKSILKNCKIIEGRAVSIGKNLRYHLIIDLLRHLFGISEKETKSVSLCSIEKVIKPLLAEEAEEAMAFTALVMGLKIPERCRRRVTEVEGEAIEILIKKNIRQLFIKLSKNRPLVILLEDIHWADKSSTDLLESLFDLAKSKRVFFINLFRPIYSEFCDRLVNKEGFSTDIKLQPLSEDACKTLIHNLLNKNPLPGYVKEKILAAGSGNPFFIEEVLRSLIDCGIIIYKNESFQFAGGINKVDIPQKISDVLMERIDMLDKTTRDIVRTASVIGKSFFYSIIKEVAGKGEDILDSLKKLQTSQFITKKIKKDGLEYGFNHELLREAAYKSILHQTKKEIHLKTAKAIESVFYDRLREFYGMLSYHYSRAGVPEMAENYMVKAGKEALRAGASNEALYYYKKALAIYLDKFGNAADPDKKAYLEKNIAFSLFSKGQHTEAAAYYKKILSHHGKALVENRVAFAAGFLFCFLGFIVNLYLPFFKKRRLATPVEIEIIELYYQRLISLSSFAPKQFFMEVFYFSRLLSKYDLFSFKGGAGMYAGISIALSWSAVSFTLSKKAISYAKKSVRNDDVRSLLCVEVADLMHCYYIGTWKKEYNKQLVEQGLRIGEIMHVVTYISFQGRIMIEKGQFKMAKKMVSKLAYIGNTYAHDFARALKYYLNTSLLLKYRKLHAALIEAQEGIAFMLRKDFSQLLVIQYSSLAKTHTLLKDRKAAKKAIMEAALIHSNTKLLPPYLANYFLGKSCYELSELKEMITSNKMTKKAKKNTLVLLKKMLKRTNSIACDRTEAFRMMGYYYDLIGERRKAMNWYRKGIQEGKALDAKPELARVYIYFGLFLLKYKKNQEDAAWAHKYVENARRVCKEMNLEWDMAEIKQKTAMLKSEADYV